MARTYRQKMGFDRAKANAFALFDSWGWIEYDVPAHGKRTPEPPQGRTYALMMSDDTLAYCIMVPPGTDVGLLQEHFAQAYIDEMSDSALEDFLASDEIRIREYAWSAGCWREV